MIGQATSEIRRRKNKTTEKERNKHLEDENNNCRVAIITTVLLW